MIFRIVGLDPSVDLRSRGICEPEKFRDSIHAHISVEQNQVARVRGRILRIGASLGRNTFHPHRRRLDRFPQIRFHIMASRVLEAGAQGDLILRSERQNALRRKGPAPRAEPDELAFNRRRESKRGNGRWFADLVGGHHLGGETKLEGACRLEPAGGQKELHRSVFGKRGSRKGKKQSKPK